MSNPRFQIRHTGEYTKFLSYDDFMQYKTNCHTVVQVSIIGDRNATFPYIFNPRIINKFVCLRELHVSNVRFLHPIFTCPKLINSLHLYECTKLKSVILNSKLTELKITYCNDLIAIGPMINKDCVLIIIDCPNFQTLPRDYYHDDDDNYGFYLHLCKVPNARLDTLRIPVSTLMLYSYLNYLPKRMPTITSKLDISAELFNSTYEQFSNVQFYAFNAGTLSIPAIHSLIDNVITNNSRVDCTTIWKRDSAVAFIVYCISWKHIFTNNVPKGIDYDMVFELLTQVCPKYFVPVTAIKFDPTFSLYESIIIAALPHFYKCLCVCKIVNPTKFSIFCNKMRDAMRQQ